MVSGLGSEQLLGSLNNTCHAIEDLGNTLADIYVSSFLECIGFDTEISLRSDLSLRSDPNCDKMTISRLSMIDLHSLCFQFATS